LSAKGQKENFEIRIRPITMGIEIELEEIINLREYECSERVTTKSRRTTWEVAPYFTLQEALILCKLESVFNGDYGERRV